MSMQLPKRDESSIIIEWEAKGRPFIKHIMGDFTSKFSSEFRHPYNSIAVSLQKYIINFKQVSYIDSTTLGMILALREHAHNRKTSIHVRNMNDVINDWVYV